MTQFHGIQKLAGKLFSKERAPFEFDLARIRSDNLNDVFAAMRARQLSRVSGMFLSDDPKLPVPSHKHRSFE